ncbi:Cyclic nucleotide-gated channel rod photoreceptor subunit alpha CNG channel 3, variant 2 [Balamuthia mandrillaris]
MPKEKQKKDKEKEGKPSSLPDKNSVELRLPSRAALLKQKQRPRKRVVEDLSFNDRLFSHFLHHKLSKLWEESSHSSSKSKKPSKSLLLSDVVIQLVSLDEGKQARQEENIPAHAVVLAAWSKRFGEALFPALKREEENEEKKKKKQKGKEKEKEKETEKEKEESKGGSGGRRKERSFGIEFKVLPRKEGKAVFEVTLPTKDRELFKHSIEFMYTGNTKVIHDLRKDFIVRLLEIAHFFGIDGLKVIILLSFLVFFSSRCFFSFCALFFVFKSLTHYKAECGRVLGDNVSQYNFEQFLETARDFECHSLKESVGRFLASHTFLFTTLLKLHKQLLGLDLLDTNELTKLGYVEDESDSGEDLSDDDDDDDAGEQPQQQQTEQQEQQTKDASASGSESESESDSETSTSDITSDSEDSYSGSSSSDSETNIANRRPNRRGPNKRAPRLRSLVKRASSTKTAAGRSGGQTQLWKNAKKQWCSNKPKGLLWQAVKNLKPENLREHFLMGLEPSVWAAMLRADELALPEEKIFRAVLVYASQFEDDKAKHYQVLSHLLPNIRYRNMFPEFLVNVVEKDENLQALDFMRPLLFQAFKHKAYPGSAKFEPKSAKQKPRAGNYFSYQYSSSTSFELSASGRKGYLRSNLYGTYHNLFGASPLTPENDYVEFHLRTCASGFVGIVPKTAFQSSNTSPTQMGGHVWTPTGYYYNNASQSRYSTCYSLFFSPLFFLLSFLILCFLSVLLFLLLL